MIAGTARAQPLQARRASDANSPTIAAITAINVIGLFLQVSSNFRGAIFMTFKLRTLLALFIWVLSLPAMADKSFLDGVQKIEAGLNARIGVVVLNTQTGASDIYRGSERFPLLSTFKTLACAHLLHLAEQGQVSLDALVPIKRSDLVPYAPVTEKQIGGPGMSPRSLCHATMTTSDNTAANLILRATGGPSALTGFLRTLGDQTTRLDRWEVELNSAIPGDERDTTTPLAMIATLRKLALDDALSTGSRRQLIDWMKGTRVADQLLRSVLPSGWEIADRTGAGENGARAITAIVWPPERPPLVIAIYITETDASFARRNAAIADIGKQLFDAIASTD